MKKISKLKVVFLFLTLILSLNTAFSVKYNKNVTVRNVDRIEAKTEKNKQDKMINLDIFWNDMEFVFTETDTISWNSKKNEYEFEKEEGWLTQENSFEIKNISSESVKVKFSYISKEKYKSIVGTFDNSVITVAPNEKGQVSFKLDGKIPESLKEYTVIGTIVISIV